MSAARLLNIRRSSRKPRPSCSMSCQNYRGAPKAAETYMHLRPGAHDGVLKGCRLTHGLEPPGTIDASRRGEFRIVKSGSVSPTRGPTPRPRVKIRQATG